MKLLCVLIGMAVIMFIFRFAIAEFSPGIRDCDMVAFTNFVKIN